MCGGHPPDGSHAAMAPAAQKWPCEPSSPVPLRHYFSHSVSTISGFLNPALPGAADNDPLRTSGLLGSPPFLQVRQEPFLLGRRHGTQALYAIEGSNAQ